MAICPGCGNQVDGNMKFCPKCGSQISSEDDKGLKEKKKAPKKRGGKSLIMILTVIAVVGILIGGIGIPMTVHAYQEKRIQSHLELGNKYLLEENYEQALAEFQTVASILPKKTDAYLGMGQAYYGMENYESAKSCMIQAFEYYDSEKDSGSEDTVITLVLNLAEYEKTQGSLESAEDFLYQASGLVDSSKIMKKLDEIEQLIKEEEAVRLSTEEKYKELLQTPDSGIYDAERQAIEHYKKSIQDLIDKGRYTDAATELERWQKIIDAINQTGECQLSVEQVDVSEFPKVKVYVRVENKSTGESVDDLLEEAFYVSERVEGEDRFERKVIIKAIQLDQEENLNICMVGDISSSMSGSSIQNAKMIMTNFLGSIQTSAGDMASLITFDSQVYTNMNFTSDIGQLSSAVQQLTTQGMTAFYDALYVSINQTAMQNGAKCIIAFTDGSDNESKCTPEIVTELAVRYNIPIFIIGIDPSISLDTMTSIAGGSGGFYKNINDITNMSEIYQAIYRQQKELYLLEYETQQQDMMDAVRAIEVNYMDENTVVRNSYEYVPSIYMEATVSSAQMFVNDFIIYDSDSRYITAADLALLTPEQLRLARNEIYARRGRMFKDQVLQNYFSSKPWYTPSISPDAFRESMLNDYERANAYFIADYERLKGYLR